MQTPTTPTPPAVPTGTVPLSGSGPTPSRSGVKALQNAERRPADESAWRFFFAPFFAAHNRRRFTALLVFGLLGHLFGETARSVVHMVLLETGEPGQMIGGMGQAVFFFSFLPGAFFEILWIGILFLFAVSIYLETERGSRTITHWLPFNINDGLSYLFWTFLFMFLSGIPGYLFWFFSIASIRFSDSPVIDLFCRIASQALAVGFSIFLTFPLLFLCVIESETFWGGLPRKTLQSIRNRPAHWLCFYLLSMPIVAGMLFAVLAPVAANTLFGDSWFFQSFLYFPAVAVWVAVTMSFLPLFYFRLLGRLGARIREE
ncbi:MAG TPA: hypothetical protein DEB39_00760 [Planctomycetaceae bacterium]|nr:hypothetical protein [Planctomycetaceae bacterium]